ncbi:MAG TPA: hypothetical protein PKY96_07860 [Flavobacteriales bacterium]|nr:hypothetical protein [Flavobacteriales bacterium]
MTRLSVLLVTMLLVGAAFSKGRAWSYTMEGTAYDKTTSDVLRNTGLMIGKQIVITDENGWYTVLISGITCDRGGGRHAIDRCNEDAFGHLVVRQLFTDAVITIRTQWRQHACIDRARFTPPCGVSRRDLFLP